MPGGLAAVCRAGCQGACAIICFIIGLFILLAGIGLLMYGINEDESSNFFDTTFKGAGLLCILSGSVMTILGCSLCCWLCRGSHTEGRVIQQRNTRTNQTVVTGYRPQHGAASSSHQGYVQMSPQHQQQYQGQAPYPQQIHQEAPPVGPQPAPYPGYMSPPGIYTGTPAPPGVYPPQHQPLLAPEPPKQPPPYTPVDAAANVAPSAPPVEDVDTEPPPPYNPQVYQPPT